MTKDTGQSQYEVKRFGVEQEPVIVIDNLIKDPDDLRRRAASLRFERRGLHYPGIRAMMDYRYLGEVSSLLKSIVQKEFGYQKGAEFSECSFSLVTTKPEQLEPIQCLPHFDGAEENKLAILYYLCEPSQGGTAFYRHKASGFETVNVSRYDQFLETLRAEEIKLGDTPKAYFSGDTDQYERIGQVDAKYNRCVIYRGYTLHSGDIPRDLTFEENPLTGRLTVNTFLYGH